MLCLLIAKGMPRGRVFWQMSGSHKIKEKGGVHTNVDFALYMFDIRKINDVQDIIAVKIVHMD